jgi:prophage tail gpP-like protein
MTLTLTYADTLNANQSEFIPGDKITASLGDTLVFTGFVDGVYPRIKANAHTVTMVARSAMRNLVDCSIDLSKSGAQFIGGGSTVFDIATALAAPFGITVVNTSQNTLSVLPAPINFTYGDPPWSVITQAAAWSGVLLLDNEKGQLVIADVGSSVMNFTAKLGVNVEECATNFSKAMRYSDVYTVYSSPIPLQNVLTVDIRGHASDPLVTENRPLYLVCEQPNQNLDIAQTRAQWEVNYRFGQGYNAEIVLNTWLDNSGNLFKPNALLDIDLTQAKMPAQRLVITSVTYSKNLQTGTRCTLTLTIRDALDPQPLSIINPAFALLPSSPSATPTPFKDKG